MNDNGWARYRNYAGLIVFIIIVLLVPIAAKKYLTLMIFVGMYSIVAIGLCLVMGYAGQISLGHAAFMGMGAYSSAILTVKFFPWFMTWIGKPELGSWWVWPWVAMLVGMGITGTVAYLIGIPIFKLRGHYLAMATLAFGIIVSIAFLEFKSITGGGTGTPGVPRLAVGSVAFWPQGRYYYLVWGVTLVVLILALNIVNSRVGRALRSIHGSEVAANTLGVDTDRYKLQILAVSGVFASIAGSLYAHYMTVVTPGPFRFLGSMELVIMVAIGGLASVWGAPFGAAATILLKDTIRDVMPTLLSFASGEHERIAYGLILVLIMIFMPEGLTAGLMNALRRMLLTRSARRRIATETSFMDYKK